MQDPSYQDYPTQQELFGIEFAPPKVRSHGLKEAHTYPLVSQGKRSSGEHSASFRVPAAEAWDFPEIEFRTGNSWPCMIQDIDGANALYRLVDAVETCSISSLANWTVTRKGGRWDSCESGHLATSSASWGSRLRTGPLKALARVSEYYAHSARS